MKHETILSKTETSIIYRDVEISRRSRIILWFMRLIAKPMLTMMAKSSPSRIAKIQLQVASMKCPNSSGLPINYEIVGSQPGHVIGKLNNTDRPVILWLHGGAFSLPAAPAMHLTMVAYLCRQLDADGFMPDYRLAPASPYPAGIDDCEAAYRDLLALGYPASNIILGGDSAGGNFLFALLQRIRNGGLPMPCCAIPVSPVTELSRIHNPPSRYQVKRSDPLLPIAAMQEMRRDYVADADSSHPEISPMYMDCEGMPPLFFLASTHEILMDDTLFLARRMIAAGIDTTCHIWPLLPHAFPLFADYFPEAASARDDIVEFVKRHLKTSD